MRAGIIRRPHRPLPYHSRDHGSLMQGIYWIASYPRSGNTWLRSMLDSYDRGGQPVDINNMPLPSLTYDRAFADEAMGLAMADLTPSEVLALRPAVMRAVRDHCDSPVMLKTHDMRLMLADGNWLLPADVSLGGVYLVRDPRDVVLSLARFLDCAVDDAITIMGTSGHMRSISGSRQVLRLVSLWGSWSEHAGSWLSPEPFAIHVVRYEDLRRDPAPTLQGILRALGRTVDEGKIAAAVAETSLSILRRQEEAHGFVERWGPNRFFGSGQVGGWRRALSPEQAARICHDHEPVMRRLGYLD